MVTRLQSDHGGAAPGGRTGSGERYHLGMFLTRWTSTAHTGDLPGGIQNDRTNRRIGISTALDLFGGPDRQIHGLVKADRVGHINQRAECAAALAACSRSARTAASGFCAP
ncbi:Uncharacterised protein [Mycobacteroides abscessus subsp. abscessus]|nr:Uncharacterised protein [Mycobacteroides abscessus subsp. abscessus]